MFCSRAGVAARAMACARALKLPVFALWPDSAGVVALRVIALGTRGHICRRDCA